MAAAQEEETNVKGGMEMMKQAAKGLALFETDTKEVTLDEAGATAHKDAVDAEVKKLDDEAAALTGKDNKKARTEKGKEAAALKADPKYIDATLVSKGKEPKNGNFATIKQPEKKVEAKTDEPEEAKKDDKDKKDKPKKAMESTGISKDERAELEKLKTDIISRKTELKAGGMSGGQINKDEQVAGWVKRMNDLKEKENPGSTTDKKKDEKKKKGKQLSKEAEAQVGELERELAEYEEKLRTEFKYSKKEIAADPDLQEMKAKLASAKK